ncbi:MAG: DUF5916 domain-containing protein [Parashewanella sp.]
MKKILLSCFTLLGASIANCAIAGTPENFSITIPTLSQAANIDGELSEPQWQNAATTHLTYETRPGENTQAPVTTQAKIYSTKTSIFVAFIADDPNPQAIRANLRDRDQSWGDDTVGIKFDTFNSERLAYQFFINPYGVQADSIENELTGRESDAWDGIWYSAGKLTDKGYQVEVELPLAMFNFDDTKSVQQWGIELIRYYPRSEIHRISTNKIDRSNNCQLCQIGLATGLKGATQGSGVQITPSLVASRNSERELAPITDWNSDNEVEVGLDLRWAITPSTLLNATINPDFSQIEADAGQLNVNNTFALFFPEKRPFFLDNKDYFDTQRNLLHTRNIVAPDFGAKITSKIDDHTAALLIAQDSTTTFLLPGNLNSRATRLNTDSTNVGARYRYDFSEKLSVGTLLTAKQADDYHNYLVSTDIKYQPTQQDTLKVQYGVSQTQYPNDLAEKIGCRINDCELKIRVDRDDSFNGDFYRIHYRHAERNWDAFTLYEKMGDDFRADLGFVNRVDHNRFVIGGGYKWYPTKSFFNVVRLGGDWDISHNDKGEFIEKEAEAALRLVGKYQSEIAIGVVTRERVGIRQDKNNLAIDGNTTVFDETFVWFDAEFDPVSNFTLAFNISSGDEIVSANNELGKKLRIRPGFEWDILDNLSLEVDHNFTRLTVEKGELLNANLTDLRLNWQFSVNSFLRVSSVYTNIKRNPELYKHRNPNKQFSELNNEVLYGYKLNPLSVFYLGYSDGLVSSDQVDDLTANERRIFMKLSYAFTL